MENHSEIPSDLYIRWWKVINEEFGWIIEDKQEEEAARLETIPRVKLSSSTQPETISQIPTKKNAVMLREEEDNCHTT